MENFKPTHFTVQLNTQPGYADEFKPYWNDRIAISQLDHMKEHYKCLTTMRPVAIFKIQYKEKAAQTA
jgi:hypothetical protein